LISLHANDVPPIVEKISTRIIIFLRTSPQSKVCTQNYGPPKLRESQFREFHNSILGVSRQNDIWVLVLWLGTKNTIRGKVVVSPNPRCGEFCEFMFVHGSSVHQKCFKYALTNLLLGLCRSMWVIDLFVTLPSLYPKTPTHPSTFEVLRTREHTPTPRSSIVFTLNSHLSLLTSLRVCHNHSLLYHFPLFITNSYFTSLAFFSPCT